MKNWLILFSQGKGMFMFIRAQLSAQIATVTDFLLSIILHQFFGCYYMHATLCGAITGGLVNCAVNYKWTFHTKDCSPMYVVFKYVLVWIGSIGLNLWGTYLLTEFLIRQESIFHLKQSTAFIVAKVITSVAVAVCWNYNLHRVFVFKDARLNYRIKKRIKQIKSQHGNKKTS